MFIRGGSNTQEPAYAGEPLGRFNSSVNNGGIVHLSNVFRLICAVFLPIIG
jgi:hypothetical protein